MADPKMLMLIVSTLFLIKLQAAPTPSLPKLLIVSYDAFRYDYFDRNVTTYLKEIKTRGIHAEYMINAFPTKTFPNHFTIATGLYVENHGVVDSEYHDVKSGKKVQYSYDLFHYNNDTTPIWILNEKAGNGRRSGVEMWVGGEYEYGGTKSTFSTSLNMNTTFQERIDEVLSWFNHPETPINLAMLYVHEPDHHGHGIGVNNDQFNEILKQIDNTTRYLHTKLKETGLSDVNVIHVSDHGMTNVALQRILDFSKYVNSTDYDISGKSPMMNIFPHPGKEESVYANLQKAAEELKGFDVYLKKDIPERYRYKDNSRIGSIVIICQNGYAFQSLYDEIPWFEKEFNITISDNSELGLHGYDNLIPDMHPIFFGLGPAFVPRCKIDPFNNVDLFPLFCDILDLPQPKVDGTLNSFKTCLAKYHK